MDPNALLNSLLQLTRYVIKDADVDKKIDQTEQAVELAEMVQSLDQWLANGGFYPRRWHHKMPLLSGNGWRIVEDKPNKFHVFLEGEFYSTFPTLQAALDAAISGAAYRKKS